MLFVMLLHLVSIRVLEVVLNRSLYAQLIVSEHCAHCLAG